MTSSVTSLTDYLKHLHLFGETFGLHTKTSTSVIVEIPRQSRDWSKFTPLTKSMLMQS